MYSYSGDPARSPEDGVRFLIGDTDKHHFILTDAEITYAVKQTNSLNQAALQCCYAILKKLAPRPNETVGPVSVDNAAVIANIKASIAAIKYAIATSTVVPFAGGISETDKQGNQTAADVVQPTYYKNMLQPSINEGDPYVPNTTINDDIANGDGLINNSGPAGPEI